MPEPSDKSVSPTASGPDASAEYERTYSVLFQAWLILFLAVICFALANYLYSYIPR